VKARIEELTGRKPFYIVADLTKRKDLEKSVKEVADIETYFSILLFT